MVSGIELAPEEKKFIQTHKDTMFPSQIAATLSKEYPLINGGYRSPETIRDYIKKTTL